MDLSRFNRNGVQLWGSGGLMLAFTVKAWADIADQLPSPPSPTILGTIVAFLWFCTALVNAIRGKRERSNGHNGDSAKAIAALQGRHEEHLERFDELAKDVKGLSRDLVRLETITTQRLASVESLLSEVHKAVTK